MVEKRIQNTAIDISPNANNSLEVEGVGEEIQLQEPENTNKGYEIIQEQDGGVTLDFDPSQKQSEGCLLYTSPSPRDGLLSRMPSSA